MTLQSVLEYELLHVKSYSLTVSDLLSVFLILFFTKVLLMIIGKLIKRFKKETIDAGRKDAFFQIVKYLVWTISLLTCIQTLGFNLSVIVASSAALFIGLGLGIQEVFKDFISGVILLFEGTLEVNDVVEVDGMVGKVSKVGFRTTEIINRNEINVIVPNSKFTSNSVINWSHNYEKTRFKIEVGVAYGSDIDKVEGVLRRALTNNKRVLRDECLVRFEGFGDSSLNFELFFWTEEIFFVEQIKSDIRKEIYRLFNENGISIPFPQRDVHIKNPS